MKNPEVFPIKRKRRDKANKRWIKERALVVPGVLLSMLAGAVAGGLVAHLLIGTEAMFGGMLVGSSAGAVLGTIGAVRAP